MTNIKCYNLEKGGEFMDIKELYKVSEVAKITGFSRQGVLWWIRKGKIKAIKGMKEYRIPKKEVEKILGKEIEEWIRENTL